MTTGVVHLLGRSQGGMRRHVRYLAAHPPEGFFTQRVIGPANLRGFFAGLPFSATPGWRLPLAGRDAGLVHAHGLTAGSAALSPGGPPVVLTLHLVVGGAGRTARSRALLRLARAVVRRADAVIAVSGEAARGFPRAVVVPPATEPLAAPTCARDDVRRHLGTSASDVVVVTVARLHPDKRLDLFVDAVRAAGCVGWIAGDGPERRRLERLVAGTRVRLLGWRDDVPDILAAADVFALASPVEGYGLAVAEAVGSGLPVIAVATGGIAEIVGGAGELVRADDADGFRDAVVRIAGDATRRAELAGRAGGSGRSPEGLVAAVGDVYRTVMR